MTFHLFFWGTVLLFVLLAFLVGLFIPVKHYVYSFRITQVPSDYVWKRISQFQNYAQWRLNLKNLKVISANEWIETDKNNDQVSYAMQILEDGRKLRTEMTTQNLPYSSVWTVEVKNVGRLTIVTMTEEGEVYHPFFRTVCKYIVGYSTPMDQYLAFLELSFAERKKDRRFWLVEKSKLYFDSIYTGLLLQPYIKEQDGFGPKAYVA